MRNLVLKRLRELYAVTDSEHVLIARLESLSNVELLALLEEAIIEFYTEEF